MAFNRFLVATAIAAVILAAMGFMIYTPPLSAANGTGMNGATTLKLAPPQQNPTLSPQTIPDFGDLPPIDLGALNSPNTPTPAATIAPEGATNPVLDITYDECDPIEDEFILIECKNGQLNFTRKETQGTRWIYYRPVLGDAEIKVNVRLPNADKNARYGVIFRLDETGENYYLLGVTNKGQYGLFRFGDGKYETIIPYTESFSVGNASFPSQIRIVNQGDVIAFDIGGQWLDSIRDPNIKSGQIALFVEPDEPGQTVLFDNLQVSEILSPLSVPTPRVPQPQPEPTAEIDDSVFNFPTDTPAAPEPTQGPQPTQTPFIIIVTATPEPATDVPTRAPTRRPTVAADTCEAPPNEAFFYIANNYSGTTMRFTIGGGEWGTHDYDVPGDDQWYRIRMPPGKYTYSAFIAGVGKASGERTQYAGGQCYSVRFSP